MRAKEGKSFIGRFKTDSDLLLSLNNFCKENNIALGVFSVIGALKSVKLGYYKQDEKKYVDCVHLAKKLEIASCTGNISFMNENVFVHAHITLADHDGNTHGGHLMPGSKIFAAEYYIKELKGKMLHRDYDQKTGLNLWPEEGV